MSGREPIDGFRVAQIDHVELFVPDQYEAARWYARVFGLQVVPEFEHWAATGPLMLATGDAGTKLAVFRRLDEPGRSDARRRVAAATADAPRREHPFHRVAFRVDGTTFAAFLQRVDGLDLRSTSGARVGAGDVVDHGEAKSIYFDDPWGHHFEITTYEPQRVSR